MRLSLLTLALMFLCTKPVFAQGYNQFHKLDMSDGLSQSFITALLKTADGFIWVGTQVGLDRLAGEDIRHFRSQRNNPKCLLGAYVHTLYEDQAGYLWVGTDKGPCRYPIRFPHRPVFLFGQDR